MSQFQLNKCVCLQDFREAARYKLPKASFEYIDSGSDEEHTLRLNQTSFQKLMIIPRILNSTSNPDLSTTIFGKKLQLPFGFAPWAMNVMCHPEGEIVPARVAKERNIMMCLSSLSSKSFSEVSETNKDGLRFMQMYVTSDWQLTKTMIRLAEKYNFTGLVITVDAQVLGIRKKQKKFVFDSSYMQFPVLQELKRECQTTNNSFIERKSLLAHRDLSMTWETIKKVREMTHLKVVLKGILHPKDAEIAVNYCDAIWVSNHGGRQLDGVESTINVLPSIKAAVGKKVPIFVDGGVRTGNDIFKCLALGADYVFVGRPVAYSLIYGTDGVRKLVKILEDQLKRTMILVGSRKLEEIKAESIIPEPHL